MIIEARFGIIVGMENTTPMLKQYLEVKAQHKDSILFFRLGDFYEMFFDDAKIASRALDLVLTSRGTNASAKVPMCGIPFHAVESYISRLIKAGHKVAICEQLEDPAAAKGIVKRDVIRVITSGTYIDDSADSRYIFSLSFDKKKGAGLAFTDITSGVIFSNQFPGREKLAEVISKFNAQEVVFPEQSESLASEVLNMPLLRGRQGITRSPQPDWSFNSRMSEKALLEHFEVHNLNGFGISDKDLAVSASGALLEYIKRMNHKPMRHINRLSLYSDSDYMYISPAACNGLELDRLFRTMDKTHTAMGKRRLNDWIYHPIKDSGQIRARQDAVSVIRQTPRLLDGLNEILSRISDIEKSLSRISSGISGTKDLLALRNSFVAVPDLQRLLSEFSGNPLLTVKDCPPVRELLERAIDPDCPITSSEGRVIRHGYDTKLDELRAIQDNGRDWLKKLQEKEIKRTGINSLKIGYNSVFGYYIVVSKANTHLVPQDYIRKQTLVNAERYITAELKEFEEKMLSAESDVSRIEKELLDDILRIILDNSKELSELGHQISAVDALYSLALLSLSRGYVRPIVDDSTEILIRDGRHPVVEGLAIEPFVPNDTVMDCQDNHLMIITGPNMAGKSTYIRQCAILVIMAQIGSWCPAGSIKVGIVDKIFTRIGAHDEITKGQSTFMVEMSETAGILNNMSPRSLVVLDEIGRGTSTFDGLSLAWAVSEYLQKHKVRTLFATHFHELTALAEELPGVKNYNIAVKKWKDQIIFLHKIEPGGCDDSYGIYVAKLAGVPAEVIKRGSEILTNLELSGDLHEKIQARRVSGEKQLLLFSSSQGKDPAAAKIRTELENLDLDMIKPIDALNIISAWKEMVDKDGKS